MIRLYLEGRRIIDLTGRLVRGRLRSMEYGYIVKHRPGRKHMAAGALSQVPTNQTDYSNIRDDLTSSAVVDYHDQPDERNRNEQTLLTTQKFTAAPQENAYCRRLVKKANALDSSLLYEEFSIF